MCGLNKISNIPNQLREICGSGTLNYFELFLRRKVPPTNILCHHLRRQWHQNSQSKNSRLGKISWDGRFKNNASTFKSNSAINHEKKCVQKPRISRTTNKKYLQNALKDFWDDEVIRHEKLCWETLKNNSTRRNVRLAW